MHTVCTVPTHKEYHAQTRWSLCLFLFLHAHFISLHYVFPSIPLSSMSHYMKPTPLMPGMYSVSLTHILNICHTYHSTRADPNTHGLFMQSLNDQKAHTLLTSLRPHSER